MNKYNHKSLHFIDVFAGAGGFSNGLEQAGLKCLLGIDMDKNAMATFKANHHDAAIFSGPVHELNEKKLRELIGNKSIHVVVGGPPCQGFSTVGLGDPKDKRNSLFKEFIRIVRLTNPYFVVIENVTGILAKKNEKILRAIFKLFHEMGYNLDVQVMSAEDFGVAERRRRTIFIGSRINDEIIFPKKLNSTPVIVGDVLKNLKTAEGDLFNHDIELAQIKSNIDKARLSHVPEGCGIRYERDEKAYLPKNLKLKIDWKKLREGRFRQAKYQRLDRKKPSPTILTHRQSYYHPLENRYLTQREAAAIQSFPNDFIFKGPLSSQWRQIGNAVPPLLGKAIGQAILKMFNQKVSFSKTKQKANSKSSLVKDIRSQAFMYSKEI